jgi:hypothetical protein
MKPRLLFIIASDPMASPRPAEAIRIAAGIGVWKKVDVRVYLRNNAVLALGEFTDDLVDEENFTRYLPLLGQLDQPLYVERGSPLLARLGAAPVRFEEISEKQLAECAAQSSSVLHF